MARASFCMRCGARLGRSDRCPACQRMARIPRWSLVAIGALIALGFGWWRRTLDLHIGWVLGPAVLCGLLSTLTLFVVDGWQPTPFTKSGSFSGWRGELTAAFLMIETILIGGMVGTGTSGEGPIAELFIGTVLALGLAVLSCLLYWTGLFPGAVGIADCPKCEQPIRIRGFNYCHLCGTPTSWKSSNDA